MSAVKIKVDQSGKPPGVAGQARQDLALGSTITLSAIGGPYLSYLWSFGWKTIDILAQTRSAAALSAPTSSSTLCSPIDIAGTYRVTLAVDSGSGLGAKPGDNASMTFYAGPTLNADPRKFPRRSPAVGETTEHNVPDGVDPTGNVDGWARERQMWDLIVQTQAQQIAILQGTINDAAYGATTVFDFALARTQRVALAGNITTLTLLNMLAGATYEMIFVQGAGGQTVVWPAGMNFGALGAPTLSVAAGAKDILTGVYDGVKLDVSSVANGF